MGLIKAATDAISSTLSDQWEDYISCDSLNDETLMVKKTTKSGQISSKSRIQVAPGQVAIIFDSGKILDATAEQGIYTFDSSSSPTLFAGQFGDVFKEAWQRFTYNGTPAKEQAIYYINIKEIRNNYFGSSSPIPYDDPLYHDIRIKYHGVYSFAITNPIVFFSKVAGNVSDRYLRKQLMEQADKEFLQGVAGALGRCAADGIKYSTLSTEQERISNYMKDALDTEWRELRGIEVVEVALDTPVPDDDSQKRIEKFADARFYSNQEMAAGRMVDATANAMEKAADNDKGAATGFMGLGMMNMTSGYMNGGQSPVAFTKPSEPAAPAAPAAPAEPAAPAAPELHCPECGNVVTGKFCAECGAPAPEAPKANVCPKCGAETLEGAKFCVECGESL